MVQKHIIKAIKDTTEMLLKDENYNCKEVGISFGYDTCCIVIEPEQLGYKEIQDILVKEHGYTTYNDHYKYHGDVHNLSKEEYVIKNGYFSFLNTWGKISLMLDRLNFTEDGIYVVQHGNTVVELELYNSYRYNKDSKLQPRKSFDEEHGKRLDIFKNISKAEELKIHFIPPYHIWKRNDWETYPDDPGCGIYSTYISVFDKATGVPYNT